jgi:hypothetical protein
MLGEKFPAFYTQRLMRLVPSGIYTYVAVCWSYRLEGQRQNTSRDIQEVNYGRAETSFHEMGGHYFREHLGPWRIKLGFDRILRDQLDRDSFWNHGRAYAPCLLRYRLVCSVRDFYVSFDPAPMGVFILAMACKASRGLEKGKPNKKTRHHPFGALQIAVFTLRVRVLLGYP